VLSRLNRVYESSYGYTFEVMHAIQVFIAILALRRLVPLIFGVSSLSEFGTDIAFP
jgi:hypothetical protein